MNAPENTLMIGWTTCASAADAERLASEAIEKRLAACAQISAPIQSFYRWEGKVEQATEYRIAFKFAKGKECELGAWLLKAHPYDCPQWYTVAASSVAPGYMSWVHDSHKSG